MYGLPQSTEVNRVLPKIKVVEKFGLTGMDRSRFETKIHRIVISNEISGRTTNLTVGDITGFFILRVELSEMTCDQRLITMLFDLIPQKVIMMLECGPMCRPIVFHESLIEGNWFLKDDYCLRIDGIDLDGVWENMVIRIGEITIDGGNSLSSQIRMDEEKRNRAKEVAILEKKLASEKQPRKKKELFDRIRELRM